jgi:hypothetical protein
MEKGMKKGGKCMAKAAKRVWNLDNGKITKGNRKFGEHADQKGHTKGKT